MVLSFCFLSIQTPVPAETGDRRSSACLSAGNRKSSDKDRCFCAHQTDPRGAHAPLRFFACVGLLTDAFRGVTPNALVRPSLPAITAVPMTRFRNARLRARTSAPQSQLRNRKPAGSGPMSGTCTRFPCSAEQDLRVRVSPGRAVATKAAYSIVI